MSWFWIVITLGFSFYVYWFVQYLREEMRDDSQRFGPSTPKENPPVTTREVDHDS